MQSEFYTAGKIRRAGTPAVQHGEGHRGEAGLRRVQRLGRRDDGRQGPHRQDGRDRPALHRQRRSEPDFLVPRHRRDLRPRPPRGRRHDELRTCRRRSFPPADRRWSSSSRRCPARSSWSTTRSSAPSTRARWACSRSTAPRTPASTRASSPTRSTSPKAARFRRWPGGAPWSAPAANKAERIARGQRLYASTCLACHQPNGQGIAGAFPPLAGSDYLNADKRRAISTVLHGLSGAVVVNGQTFNSVMPALGLSDEDVANALTYVYIQLEERRTRRHGGRSEGGACGRCASGFAPCWV